MVKAAKKILGLILLLIPFFALSQNPLLNTVSLDVNNKPLEQVLSQIEEQASFSFSYNSELINPEKTISYTADNKTVEQVLNELLNEELKYLHRGSYIIIQEKNPAQIEKTKLAFSGEIVDQETGERISDANVYEIVKLKSTFTDENGDFDLEVANDYGYVDILISKENYRDTIIRVNANSNEPLYISLKKDITSTYKKVESTVVSKLDSLKFIKTFWNDNLEKLKNVDLSEEREYQLSILPFLGTNGKMSGKISNKISLNLIAGYAKGVNGFEAAGGLNIISDSVAGVQMAGMGNLVGGNVSGVQLAGGFNLNKSKFKGLQMAGFANLSADSVDGIQVSGFANSAPYFDGAQASGFVNLTHNAEGIQLTGFANVVHHDIKGVQISGGLNYAEKLRGIQLGIINIADTVESGVPIGLFSYVRKGFHKFEISYNDSLSGRIAFKTGTHRLYNILFGGYFQDDTNPLWSVGYGLGTQFNMGKRFYSNIELTAQSLQPIDRWGNNINLLGNLNLNFGVNIGKKLSINAGPVLNVFVAPIDDTPFAFGDSHPASILYEETVDDAHVKVWMGYRVGIRF